MQTDWIMSTGGCRNPYEGAWRNTVHGHGAPWAELPSVRFHVHHTALQRRVWRLRALNGVWEDIISSCGAFEVVRKTVEDSVRLS